MPMANYCSNSVRFIGDESDVAEIRGLFTDIQQKQAASHQYHLPDFVTADHGYMEDIEVGSEAILYETRWVPNLEVLDKIADYYELDYIVAYTEPMAGLYGQAVRTNGETRFVNIDTYTQKGRGNNPAFSALKQLAASMLIARQHDR